MIAVAVLATLAVLIVLALIALVTMVVVHVGDRRMMRRVDRDVLAAVLDARVAHIHPWLGDDERAGPSGLQGRMEAVVTGQVPTAPTFDDLVLGRRPRHARHRDTEGDLVPFVTEV